MTALSRSIVAILSTIVLVLGGCGAAPELRDAISIYNAAVQLEDEDSTWLTRLDESRLVGDGQAAPTPSPESGYKLCLAMLGELDMSELRKDQLTSTKLLLEALCHWRLDNYVAAEAAAIAAAASAQQEGAPRDLAVAKALPGMIKIEQARSLASAIPDDAQGKRDLEQKIRGMLIEDPFSAVNTIEAASAPVGDLSALKGVLLWYQVSAYETWWRAHVMLLGVGAFPAEAEYEIDELLDAMDMIESARHISNKLRNYLPEQDRP